MTAYLAAQFAVAPDGWLRCAEDGAGVWQVGPGTTLADLVGAAARHAQAGCRSQAQVTETLAWLGTRIDRLAPGVAARWMTGEVSDG